MLMRNCTKRNREYRVHEVLSNGQHFNLYLNKHRNSEPYGIIDNIWLVGLCISSNRKEANMWYGNKDKKFLSKQTGKCGIEGLRKAAEYLVEFAKTMKRTSEIQVEWQDNKRKRAYRRLLKYGFEDYTSCYILRNPQYWTWHDLPKEGENNGKDESVY